MGHKRRRLSKSAEFDRVYRKGRSAGNRFVVAYSFERSEQSEEPQSAEARLGVSVGRKVGGAVVRNEVKRAVREAFWDLAETLPSGHDYVVVARPDGAGLVEREGVEGVRRELADLLAELSAQSEREAAR